MPSAVQSLTRDRAITLLYKLILALRSRWDGGPQDGHQEEWPASDSRVAKAGNLEDAVHGVMRQWDIESQQKAYRRKQALKWRLQQQADKDTVDRKKQQRQLEGYRNVQQWRWDRTGQHPTQEASRNTREESERQAKVETWDGLYREQQNLQKQETRRKRTRAAAMKAWKEAIETVLEQQQDRQNMPEVIQNFIEERLRYIENNPPPKLRINAHMTQARLRLKLVEWEGLEPSLSNLTTILRREVRGLWREVEPTIDEQASRALELQQNSPGVDHHVWQFLRENLYFQDWLEQEILERLRRSDPWLSPVVREFTQEAQRQWASIEGTIRDIVQNLWRFLYQRHGGHIQQ
ncbi:hypothetical protein N7492_010502 [Penicillium capsulatum]|uniref:Uncharacterized protein n=1 Tax=Penicillium capsulatum TaxID=69766 RepID=A0A9W9HMJ8_9EURO|nr:hypothetical protein N7492_010502 [Penicillium capsulatum]